ncbi:hypothetical protein TNCV_2993831 [Trichonephila clavipes]|nr:hypothetical protein TNCV_2993831 [Trichonephila clavipes]
MVHHHIGRPTLEITYPIDCTSRGLQHATYPMPIQKTCVGTLWFLPVDKDKRTRWKRIASPSQVLLPHRGGTVFRDGMSEVHSEFTPGRVTLDVKAIPFRPI